MADGAPSPYRSHGALPVARDWIFVASRRPTARSIMAEVAREHGVAVEDLTGPSRKRSIAYVRFIAMRRIRAETKLSTPQIGKLFNRDHTTVCHALGTLSRERSIPSDMRRAA
jgi:chromosomal replication initiator protein